MKDIPLFCRMSDEKGGDLTLEQNLELENQEAKIQPHMPKFFRLAILISLVLSVVSIITAFYVLNIIKQQEEKTNEMMDVLDAHRESIDVLTMYTFFLDFENRISEGIVTDDLIIHKAVLTNSDKEKLKGTIDISLQPNMFDKYEGSGKFSVSDRELKSMLLSLMEELGRHYNDVAGGDENLPKWETAEIRLTIQNYDLGTYENGEIKLKGE